MLEDNYLAFTAIADQHGMLYVHPDGTTDAAGKRFWNATDACCDLDHSGIDDSTYLSTVIAQVMATYNVDPRRVYIVGHSNGGYMAYRFACDHAELVAAVVSLEGATFADPSSCKPSQPVTTLEIHGTADDTTRYDGGSAGGKAYPGALTTTQTWATYNRCALIPDEPAPADRHIAQGLPLAKVQSYANGCAPGGHAELWTQPNGSHVPSLDPTFAEQVAQYLLAHPKP